MSQITEEAVFKIENEAKHFTGDRRGNAVSRGVADALKQFCINQEFASAVAETEKTLSECVAYVVTDCKDSLSDFDAYKRAARFYFPQAKVVFNMEITLDEPRHASEIKPGKVISLLDLL